MVTPEPETISFMRVFIAFAVVFGLIALMGIGLKHIGMKGLKIPRRYAGLTGRLQLVESIALDMKRRVVIVRQDDQEHLLLLGLNQDIVISANLKKPSQLPEQ